MNRKITPQTLLFLFIATALSAWLGGLFSFTRGIDTMVPPSPPHPLDAIVVLTGGSNRLEEGFKLLEQGSGKKMYISGVYRGVDVKELMALLKDQKSAALECCIALGDAENTVENATESIHWLKTEGFHSFYLVTANYHMRRALLEFERTSPDATIVPWPVIPEKLDMKHWWKDDAARALIIREYSKFIFSLIKPIFSL